MARTTPPRSAGRFVPSPGHHSWSLETDASRDRDTTDDRTTAEDPPGFRAADPPRGERATSSAEDRARRVEAEHLLLFGGDRFVAVASGGRIQVSAVDALPNERQRSRVVAQVTMAAPVLHLVARPGDQRIAFVAALADRSLVDVEVLDHRVDQVVGDKVDGRGVSSARDEKVRLRVMQKDIGRRVQTLVCTNRDQPVQLTDDLPFQVRLRLEIVDGAGSSSPWVTATVQSGGSFSVMRQDFKGPASAELRVQAWFDRTDLLASSRSAVATCPHQVAPVID